MLVMWNYSNKVLELALMRLTSSNGDCLCCVGNLGPFLATDYKIGIQLPVLGFLFTNSLLLRIAWSVHTGHLCSNKDHSVGV